MCDKTRYQCCIFHAMIQINPLNELKQIKQKHIIVMQHIRNKGKFICNYNGSGSTNNTKEEMIATVTSTFRNVICNVLNIIGIVIFTQLFFARSIKHTNIKQENGLV